MPKPRPQITEEEQLKIAIHIAKNGVTKCPAPFSQEMIDMNVKNTAEWRAGLKQSTRNSLGLTGEMPKKERAKRGPRQLKDYEFL